MTIDEHLIFREISKIINNGVSDNSIIDEKNFTPSFEENDAYIVVNMKPKKNKMKNVLGNMKIYFDKSSCLVHKIEITDNNFSYSRFSSTNLKDVDFRSNDISCIIFDNYSLKGIKVDTFQCRNIVSNLGVIVED